jgi:hypothetical protein
LARFRVHQLFTRDWDNDILEPLRATETALIEVPDTAAAQDIVLFFDDSQQLQAWGRISRRTRHQGAGPGEQYVELTDITVAKAPLPKSNEAESTRKETTAIGTKAKPTLTGGELVAAVAAAIQVTPTVTAHELIREWAAFGYTANHAETRSVLEKLSPGRSPSQKKRKPKSKRKNSPPRKRRLTAAEKRTAELDAADRARANRRWVTSVVSGGLPGLGKHQ